MHGLGEREVSGEGARAAFMEVLDGLRWGNEMYSVCYVLGINLFKSVNAKGNNTFRCQKLMDIVRRYD